MMARNAVVIRPARPEDAEALLGIYAPYVRETAVTFEYEVPSPEEFRNRIQGTLERYPYLLAEAGDSCLGYAYTGPFKDRAAYAWSAESSIYLRRDARRRGLGRRLYAALEDLSQAQGIQNLNACIGCPAAEEDPYLTRDSLAFHACVGYRLAGEFHQCGYKFGRWYNMVWMEKPLGPHPAEPLPVIPFPALLAEGKVNTICNQYSE